MRNSAITKLAFGLALYALLGAVLPSSHPQGQPEEAEKPVELAVIVNAKNPTTDLTLRQLKSYFKQNRKYWPNKSLCQLFLRPSKSVEMGILLKEIYSTSYGRLRRKLVSRLNSGDISYIPQILNTDQDAIDRVRRNPGAFTVVRADKLPPKIKGIRILTIDRLKPGQEKYPLVLRPAPASLTASR